MVNDIPSQCTDPDDKQYFRSKNKSLHKTLKHLEDNAIPKLEELSDLDKQYFDTLSVDYRNDSKNLSKTAKIYDTKELKQLKSDGNLSLIDRYYINSPEFNFNKSAKEPQHSRMAQIAREIKESFGFSQNLSKNTRNSVEKLDTHGYRVPDEDLIKFNLLTEFDASKVLINHIVGINDDILLINKPPFLSVHSGPDLKHTVESLMPRVIFNLTNKKSLGSNLFLHKLSEELIHIEKKCNKLECLIPHRIDKDASGLLMVSLTRDKHLKLTEAFAKRLILKQYLCLTSRIPTPTQMDGFIEANIFLRASDSKNGRAYKNSISVLKSKTKECRLPGLMQNSMSYLNQLIPIEKLNESLYSQMSHHEFKIPLTHYQILAYRNDCCLVNCSAVSGTKHQVRIHLAHGLRSPILGDHKFSHISHMAPQRLRPRTLEALNIRQSKSRYLGLHLHAWRLQYPSTPKGSDQELVNGLKQFDFQSTHLFNNFYSNLKRIGLKLPKYLNYLIK